MDKLDVTFQGTVSEYENCMCSCCHDSAKVLKLQIPETLYFDGKSLSTKYHGVWVCKSCAQKMIGELEKLIPQPENKPLTLEQLRGMDGMPVYCIGIVNKGLDGYGLVNVKDAEIIDSHCDCWTFKKYGKNYIAYRAKPEQEESK